ncbi:MAG TPA: hypothetical protein VM618_05860, partial [Acidimicrobiia bacterium]|nr:hypothetical protein [Acidimicrobiia bacterium]
RYERLSTAVIVVAGRNPGTTRRVPVEASIFYRRRHRVAAMHAIEGIVGRRMSTGQHLYLEQSE